jgi:hypothetical protein
MLKDLEKLQKKAEKKARLRDKKKKTKMLVSGKSVFGLQRTIKKRISAIDH